MPNAVIYARYSSHSQTEQSIDGQLRECYAFAEHEGYTVISEYIDRALTGRYDDRPEFQRMIHDSKKKQFEYVLVWKLDRFSRNRYDSATYKYKLKQNGARVRSAMENIGDGDESVILEAMLEAFAEYYSLNLSTNIRRGIRESVLKGTSIGGKTPLGFITKDKKLLPDPQYAALIQEIFTRYSSGETQSAIAKDLNSRGCRTREGAPFNLTSFEFILKNRKYLGEYSLHGVVSDMYPQLIDEQTFEAAQRRLLSAAHAGQPARAHVPYLLTGKAFCGVCGGKLIGESGKSRNGTMHYYYTCLERKKRNACIKKPEIKDNLEGFVVDQTVAYLADVNNLDKIARGLLKAYEKEFNITALKELERLFRKIEKDVDKYSSAFVEAPTKTSREKISQKLVSLEAEKEGLGLDIAKNKIASEVKISKASILEWLKLFSEGDPTDPEFQKRLIDIFVNSVYVYDDRATILFNAKDDRQDPVRIDTNMLHQILFYPNFSFLSSRTFGSTFNK